MNFNFFLKGITNSIFSPAKFWDSVKSENPQIRLTRNSFLVPLAFLVAVSAFAGSLIFTNTEMSPGYSVMTGIKCFIVIYLSTHTAAWLIREITFPLDLGRDFNNAFRLVVFSAAPFLICQIVSRMFESLLFINIIGFYGLYIFWTGAEKLLNPPQYKKIPLVIAASISFTVIYIAFEVLLTMVTGRLFHNIFS